MSCFSDIKPAPPVAVFALSQAFKADTDPRKVDLGVGAYRDNSAKPWVLPVVKKVEIQLAESMGNTLDHEYLGQTGIPDFTNGAVKLALGNDAKLKEGLAAGVQCLSGTGALRVGADFLCKVSNYTDFLCSDPTWPNHFAVFKDAGFVNSGKYRYWNAQTKSLDFDGMKEDIQNAKDRTVIVLHVCAHNPTGVDLTQDQWKELAEICQKKKHFCFFDCAYQGFASGDLEKDSWVLRYYSEKGYEFFCAQSYAKNFGLYNERAGNLLVHLSCKEALKASVSQMAVRIRAMYSNPPNHGARIVATVLNTPEYYQEWLGHIKEMSSRIIKMRSLLKEKLIALQTPGSWDHITEQIGMFCYTGLTEAQVAHIISEHHVYLMKDGRISMAGLNDNNVDHVAKAFNDAVVNKPSKL